MLWPRITVPRAGYNLAISGAVGRNAYDDEEVALELVAYLKGRYAGLLAARFKVPNAGTLQDEELLEDIGRRRGALLGRGKVNLQKAAEIVIFEFRAATLGRITLETPEEFLAWTAEGEAAEALRQSRRDERKRTKTPRATPAAPDEEK
jgi:ribosome biogenesis GTPase A